MQGFINLGWIIAFGLIAYKVLKHEQYFKDKEKSKKGFKAIKVASKLVAEMVKASIELKKIERSKETKTPPGGNYAKGGPLSATCGETQESVGALIANGFDVPKELKGIKRQTNMPSASERKAVRNGERIVNRDSRMSTVPVQDAIEKAKQRVDADGNFTVPTWDKLSIADTLAYEYLTELEDLREVSGLEPRYFILVPVVYDTKFGRKILRGRMQSQREKMESHIKDFGVKVHKGNYAPSTIGVDFGRDLSKTNVEIRMPNGSVQTIHGWKVGDKQPFVDLNAEVEKIKAADEAKAKKAERRTERTIMFDYAKEAINEHSDRLDGSEEWELNADETFAEAADNIVDDLNAAIESESEGDVDTAREAVLNVVINSLLLLRSLDEQPQGAKKDLGIDKDVLSSAFGVLFDEQTELPIAHPIVSIPMHLHGKPFGISFGEIMEGQAILAKIKSEKFDGLTFGEVMALSKYDSILKSVKKRRVAYSVKHEVYYFELSCSSTNGYTPDFSVLLSVLEKAKKAFETAEAYVKADKDARKVDAVQGFMRRMEDKYKPFELSFENASGIFRFKYFEGGFVEFAHSWNELELKLSDWFEQSAGNK